MSIDICHLTNYILRWRRANRRRIRNLLDPRHMYTAYSTAVGGKAFNGDPLPNWKTFSRDPTKAKQADAWLAAANAARNWLCGPQ